MKPLPSKVIIIGAGPSGLFAVRSLQELAKEQNTEIECILIEREDVVGGKCHTYKDPVHPELRTEWGAGAIAPNYGVVLDALKEFKIPFEDMVSTATETIEIKELYENLHGREKITFIQQYIRETKIFNKAYDVYKKAVENKTDLPDALKEPFAKFCADNNMKYLPIAVKPFVPGFGYGDVAHCPTYSVLEYLGKTTLPEILALDNFTSLPSLLAIHGGFQVLMEKMAESYDVRLNAKVTKIERTTEKVTVHYTQNGKKCVETADTLILATSPKNWPSMHLKPTPVEQQCIDGLESYLYPVAVCKIKGLPAHQYFVPQALETKGFGHLALITTRDNRNNPEDGRLCTIYVNLPPNTDSFSFNRDSLATDFAAIEGVTDVTVVERKIWTDYMSTLPWNLRLALHQEQAKTNTLYLGSYVLGGFEDVACVAKVATTAVQEAFSNQQHSDSLCKNLSRASFFFTNKRFDPLSVFDPAPANLAASSLG